MVGAKAAATARVAGPPQRCTMRAHTAVDGRVRAYVQRRRRPITRIVGGARDASTDGSATFFRVSRVLYITAAAVDPLNSLPFPPRRPAAL